MPAEQQPSVTLWDYLLVLVRQWVILVLAVVLSLTWAFFTFVPAQPLYETSVTLRIVPPKSRDALFKDVSNVLRQDRSLEAQAKFLESPEFTELVAEEAVVRQMAKARRGGASYIWPNLDGGLDDAAAAVRPTRVDKDEANQALTLYFRARSPEQVTTLAQLVPELFAKLDKSRVNRKYGEVRSFIRRKLRDFQEREKELTQRIWNLRGSANAYVMGENALTTTEKMLADTMLKKEIARVSLDEYRNQIGKTQFAGLEAPDTAGDLVEMLWEKLRDLEFQRTLMLRDYTPAHPEVEEVSQEIELTREALSEKLNEMVTNAPAPVSPFDWYQMQVAEAMKLEIELATLERREEALGQSLSESIEGAREIATFQQQLARFESEASYFRGLRQSFHNKLVDLELSIEMDRDEGGYAEVVDRLPRSPDNVVQSNVVRHFSVWTVFGFLVGTIFAFFLDYNDTSLKTELDIRRWLGLPVLASVPILKEIKRKAFRDIITEFEQGRQTMESFRTLRTQVEFKAIDKMLKTILVTSTRPSEGKTAVMTNLAVTFAQKGEQVLLIDCDLRRPSLHRHMDLARSPGLSNVLMGEIPWQSAIQETDMPNLWVLTAGDITVNPSELLSSSQMRDLVDKLTSSYDRILFDMSSVLAVTDSAIMGSMVDGVLLVVKAYKTPRHYVQQAIEIMHNVGSNMVGVVFNQVRRYGTAYYYYYYYHTDPERRG